MEEKERYELQEVFEDGSFHWCLKDNDTKLLKPLVNLHDCVDLLNQQDQKIKDLEDKLTDSEKQIKDTRETVNMSVDSWCKNRRKYEAQIAEMQNKSFILYSMLYETLEKQGYDNVASQIDQMTGWTYDKEVNWLKGNRNYDQLEQSQRQLAISKLEDVYQVVKDYNSEANKYEPYIDTLDIEQYIDDKIKELKKLKELKTVTNEWIDATEEKCLDDLNELTEDLSWQYQLDDLDKLENKAQNIQSVCARLKQLKGEK